MDAIVAVDVGTTGTKASLIRRDGVILASAYQSYESRHEGRSLEQNPNDWWQATLKSLRALREEQPDIRPQAVALSGQMQDVILIGAEGLLAPAILYSDTRAQAEAEAASRVIGEARLREVTGNLQDASSLLAKLLWVKSNWPEIYQKAERLFVGAHDYVAWCLCGSRATDFTTAATTGLLNLRANVWATDILAELGLRTDWLPDLAIAEMQVGTVSAHTAGETGWPEGTPVFHGAGDVATATVGAGAGEPGRSYVYLGTSGWLAVTELSIPADPLTGIFNLRHPDPQRLILVGPMLTAAGNFEWVREQFGELEVPGVVGDGTKSHDRLNEQAGQSAPGSGGVLYLPYLAGERAPFRDANARGVFFGLNRKTTRADLYRAVMEGVAFSMRAIRQTMPGVSQGTEISELSLVGGGARSRLWPQIFANMFNCRVHVLANPEEVGARGAAIIAGKALGWHSDYVPAGYFPVQTTYEPDPTAVVRYNQLFEVFRDLYPVLQPAFARLAQANLS
mgnify:CR=1 FL=1